MLTNADRERLFGRFDFEHAPIPGNPERVRILGDWAAVNLVPVSLEPLRHARLKLPHVALFHRTVATSVQVLIERWRELDLHHHIITWNGSFAPRYRRGQRTHLSAHAWGSAFDVNAWQNALGKPPAKAGERGSVVELVSIAKELGFVWGGDFSRPDGMHFEAGEGAVRD